MKENGTKQRRGRVVFSPSYTDMPAVKSWEVRYKRSLLAVLCQSERDHKIHLSWGFFSPLSCVSLEWSSVDEAKADLTDLIQGYARAMRLGVEPVELTRAIDDLREGRETLYSKAKSIAWEVFPHRIGMRVDDFARTLARSMNENRSQKIDEDDFVEQFLRTFDTGEGDTEENLKDALVETFRKFGEDRKAAPRDR